MKLSSEMQGKFLLWIEERRAEAERFESTGRLDAVFVHIQEFYLETHLLGEPDERVLTAKETADYERVSTRTINDRCLRGEYPGAFRTQGDSGHWRIPVSGILLRREQLRMDDQPDPGECAETVPKTAPPPSSELQDIPNYLNEDQA